MKGELEGDKAAYSPRKTIYEFLPATEEHIRDLAPRMRFGESLAAMGMTPEQALAKMAQRTENAVAALADGKVHLMFGTFRLSLLDNDVYVWMFGDHEIPKHSMKLLRESRKWIAQLREQNERVFTFVDTAYPKAVKWLDWLGFITVAVEHLAGRRFLKMELA